MDSDEFIEKFGIEKWNKLESNIQDKLIKEKLNKIKIRSKSKVRQAFLAYEKIKPYFDRKIKSINKPIYLLIKDDIIISCGTFDMVWKKRQIFDEEIIILPVPISSPDEYWQKNTQMITEKIIQGSIIPSTKESKHNIPPKIFHPVFFDDLSSREIIELQLDTGADFTRFELFRIAYIPSKKLYAIGEANVIGHDIHNEDIYPVYELRLSSLEGGSFGWIRVLIGGNAGVMGRDLIFCFKQIIDPSAEIPTISYERIHKKPKYILFKDIPFIEYGKNNNHNSNVSSGEESMEKLMNNILKESLEYN